MTAPRIFTPEYYRRMRDLEAGGWWNGGMRDVAAALLARVDLPRQGTLLDIGCGSGQTMTWFLARHAGWRAVGLDIARPGLRAAHDGGMRAVALASALTLPYAEASVDLAITLDVLQHLPLDGGDLTALREIRRVMKPDSHLLVRTNAQAFPAAREDPEAMFRKYTPDLLRDRLERAGFEVLRLGRINAVLGLAEIPRELRARRREGTGYHGILAPPPAPGRLDAAKRLWLRVEGRALVAGARLPFGRTLLALCRARPTDRRKEGR